MAATAGQERPEPPFSIGEIVILATVVAHRDEEDDPLRRLTVAGTHRDRAEVDATCRKLLAQCALRASPRLPCGYDISLIGLARLHRFVRAPIGATSGPIDAECAVRRLVLDAVAPAERAEIEQRLKEELMEMRAGVFRCIRADLCAGRGCPFAASAEVEAIDRGLLALGEADHLQ